MSSANILIEQSGLPAGSPGVSRRDIVAGTAVQLSNEDDTGVRRDYGNQLTVNLTWTTSTTTLVITFNGTPLDAETFDIQWMLMG